MKHTPERLQIKVTTYRYNGNNSYTESAAKFAKVALNKYLQRKIVWKERLWMSQNMGIITVWNRIQLSCLNIWREWPQSFWKRESLKKSISLKRNIENHFFCGISTVYLTSIFNTNHWKIRNVFKIHDISLLAFFRNVESHSKRINWTWFKINFNKVDL